MAEALAVRAAAPKWDAFERTISPLSVHSSTPVDVDDQHLVALWLHGRGAATQDAYRRDAARFLSFAACPLGSITLGDVQAYADSLSGAPATRARRLATAKSLLAFGHRLGYLAVDVGAVVKLPPIRGTLAERILSPLQVQRLIALEPRRRNRVLLLTLYAAGLRVSELCGLRWRDLAVREDAGQVTVFGKGGKTRAILLPASVWSELLSLRDEAALPDRPVFRSRKGGGHLDRSAVDRLVRRAAVRAGLGDRVSPHWLRHAHATHALDRQTPIHLVQATLGHASVATTGRYLHARPTDSSARHLGL